MTEPATDEAAVGGLLTMLRVSRVMERVHSGVSPQQYRMLRLIGGGGERSARLAEKLAVARPTLTSTADSLVAAGLAVRQAEPGDRRVVRLCLTRPGRPRSSVPTRPTRPGSARCLTTPAAAPRSSPPCSSSTTR